MTVKDIMKLQNDFRLVTSDQNAIFLKNRKYGVTKSVVNNTWLELGFVLDKIVKGNIHQPLTKAVVCPSWLAAGDLNSIIALTKRIINEHQF